MTKAEQTKLNELDNKVDVLDTKVTKIYTALKGFNGQKGLCAEVEELEERRLRDKAEQDKQFRELRKNVWLMMGGIAVISFLLGGGSSLLVKVIGG
jgi:hypothetical protein